MYSNYHRQELLTEISNICGLDCTDGNLDKAYRYGPHDLNDCDRFQECLKELSLKNGPKYVVALGLPLESNPKIHMTICFVGECSLQRLAMIKDDMRNLIKHLPCTVTFGEKKMFGVDLDIPVRLCSIPEEAKKAFHEFYCKWYTSEPGVPIRPSQTYHVSLKNCEEEIMKLESLTGNFVFLKELGHDVVFTLKKE
jgi:hypothetical protein